MATKKTAAILPFAAPSKLKAKPATPDMSVTAAPKSTKNPGMKGGMSNIKKLKKAPTGMI